MKILQRALNIEADEEGPVVLLLVMSFFIGVFLAAFDVGSSTIFLDTHVEQVPVGFIGQGIVGFIFTSIFSYFQNRVSFAKVSVFTIITIALLVFALRSGFEYFPGNETLVYLSFFCTLPFSVIVLLIFWGAVNRMFDLSQAKRIMGSIDLGQIVATIIAFFTVPVVIGLGLASIDLLYISLIGLICTLTIFVILFIKYPTGLTAKAAKSIHKSLKLTEFPKNKYLALIGLFMIISMMGTLFIENSFLEVSVQMYPENSDLSKFLAYFGAIILLFGLFVQLFFADRIINMYGLKAALMINPIVVGIFTLLSIFVGFVFGYEPEANLFLYFFLAISLSKLFTTFVKEAFDEPVFKLFYLPVDSAYRIDIQAKTDGIIKFFGVLAAGILLYLINYMFPIIVISLLLLVVVGAWVFATDKMYNKYRSSLQDTLSNSKGGDNSGKEYAVDRVLQKELSSTNPEKIIHTVKLIEKIEPVLLKDTLELISKMNDPVILKYAGEKIEILEIKLDLSDNNNDSEVKTLALQALGNLEKSDKIPAINTAKLNRLLRSKKVEERVELAILLADVINDENISILLELLRDIEPEVRVAAMQTARKVKRPETWPYLIEQLAAPSYAPTFCNLATAALIEVGEEAIHTMELAFHKSGQAEEIMLRIIHIYGRIGTEKAFEVLWNKIDYPEKKIVNQILLSFSYWKYQATGEKAIIINNLLEEEIANAAWNIAALSEVASTEFNYHLKHALQEEIDSSFDRIFMLLGLLYDPQSIQLVRENIESGTSDGIVFALELLDVFIAKDLKAKLFPLLDDISLVEKISILQINFPRESFDSVEVLKQIINRDYNKINRWTKACAIYSFGLTPEAEITEDLIANLFNPNSMLREIAAWAICVKDKKKFDELSARIPYHIQKELEHILENLFFGGTKEHFLNMRIEKVMFLKEIPEFKNIPGIVLYELVEASKFLEYKKGEEIIRKGEKGNTPVYIIAKGTVDVHLDGKTLIYLNERQLFGEMEILETDVNIANVSAHVDCKFFQIEKDKFYELMAKYYELVEGFIDMANKKLFTPAEKKKEVEEQIS